MSVDLNVRLGPLKLKNPILTASGCFGYGLEFENLLDLNKLGGLVTKGISLEPRKGNPPVRIAETYGGMLNSIGLQNIGLDAFLREKLPPLRRFDTAIIVNIFGETLGEYLRLAERLGNEDGISALEVNISCPNVDKGGLEFGTDPELVYSLAKKLKSSTELPIMMKLTPNVTDICVIAKAAEEGGADILSLINTLKGMAVSLEERRSVLGTSYGGLSGPCIKPVALAMLHRVAQVVRIPLVGIGGIMNEVDALEFLLIGAKAIQVGTGNFVKSDLAMDVLEGLTKYLDSKKVRSVGNFIGTIEV